MSNKILNWIDLAVKNQNFIEYAVEVHGNSGKGDGYLGKITFVTVTGTINAGEKKVLNLIVKTSTTNTLLRQQIPIKKFFDEEIHIYDHVVPAFYKLQQELGIKENFLNLLPSCYVTLKEEDQEVLVLEDLKIQGFDMWDRRIPMTDDHIRLVLQGFGKWNAFSLALRQKQAEIFGKLTTNKVPLFAYHILKVKLAGVFFKFFEDVGNFYKDEPEITRIRFSEDEIENIYSNLISEDPDYHVILHGDSWTNNFMFKTEEITKKPADLRIIDWQLSGLSSPVLDLSVFIYTCVDTETHKDVRQLLKIYYETLSECLVRFGYIPSQVFPFEKLVEHWKQFSKYGLLLGTFLLKFCFSEGDETPDFVEAAEQGKEFLENFGFSIANEEEYFKRVKDNIIHYGRNLK